MKKLSEILSSLTEDKKPKGEAAPKAAKFDTLPQKGKIKKLDPKETMPSTEEEDDVRSEKEKEFFDMHQDNIQVYDVSYDEQLPSEKVVKKLLSSIKEDLGDDSGSIDNDPADSPEPKLEPKSSKDLSTDTEELLAKTESLHSMAQEMVSLASGDVDKILDTMERMDLVLKDVQSIKSRLSLTLKKV